MPNEESSEMTFVNNEITRITKEKSSRDSRDTSSLSYGQVKIIRYTAGNSIWQRQDFRLDKSPSTERMASHEDTVTCGPRDLRNLCVPQNDTSIIELMSFKESRISVFRSSEFLPCICASCETRVLTHGRLSSTRQD